MFFPLRPLVIDSRLGMLRSLGWLSHPMTRNLSDHINWQKAYYFKASASLSCHHPCDSFRSVKKRWKIYVQPQSSSSVSKIIKMLVTKWDTIRISLLNNSHSSSSCFPKLNKEQILAFPTKWKDKEWQVILNITTVMKMQKLY